jgi:hypothetical protein
MDIGVSTFQKFSQIIEKPMESYCSNILAEISAMGRTEHTT